MGDGNGKEVEHSLADIFPSGLLADDSLFVLPQLRE